MRRIANRFPQNRQIHVFPATAPIAAGWTHQFLRSLARRCAAALACSREPKSAKHVAPDPDILASALPGALRRVARTSPTIGAHAVAASVRSLSCCLRSSINAPVLVGTPARLGPAWALLNVPN